MTRATTTVLVLVLALAAPASADPRVRLDAPAEVCDPAPMRARIVELVGGDPFVGDGDTDVAIRVTVDAGARGVHATIVVDDLDDAGDGRRTIAAPDCAALSESAALVIAMVLSRPRPPPAPAGPLPVAAAPVVDHESIPIPIPILEREAEPGPPPWRGLAMYAGVAGGRAGRDVQASVVVGAALRRGRASLGLDFGLAAPDRVSIGGGRVVVTTGAFELAACGHRGRLAGCATAAVGWAHGKGEALNEATAATTPYAAAGLRLAWDTPLSDRIDARVQLGGRVPFTRNRFLVDDMAVWSTAAVEAWIGLGLVARIP